jgi:hypothetical protein
MNIRAAAAAAREIERMRTLQIGIWRRVCTNRCLPPDETAGGAGIFRHAAFMTEKIAQHVVAA